MPIQYNKFIKENVAPKKSKTIGIYDSNNQKIGRIANLNYIPKSKKLYSFGIISDTHCNESSTTNYMTEALEFFRENSCVWIGITGDIVEDGTMWDRVGTIYQLLKEKDSDYKNFQTSEEIMYERLKTFFENVEETEKAIQERFLLDRNTSFLDWENYKTIIDNHYSLNGCPIFAIAGNHEQYRYDNHECENLFNPDLNIEVKNFALDYTGIDKPTFFLFNVNENNKLEIISEKEYLNNPYLLDKYDNVIMCLGCHRYHEITNPNESVQVVDKETLFKIQSDFELLRNKRMIVLTHIPVQSSFTNFNFSEVQYNKWVPPSIYEHYSNCIVFHGHTHSPFSKQNSSNYNTKFNFKSAHAPHVKSLGEGYLVEVYEDGLLLKGFKHKNFLPTVNYWIDMPINNIPENSYNFDPITI